MIASDDSIRFIKGELPDCYVIPATVFNEPDGSLFTSRDYEGLKSQPEYGISVTKKSLKLCKDTELIESWLKY